MAGDTGRTLRQSLGVLRPGPFRRYMVGEAFSTTGTWMQVMAEAWVMTTLTTSAFTMGLVTFATGLPVLMLTMVGGAAADKYPKRTIVLVCQTGQIALASVMGVLVYTQAVQVWHVVAVAACAGVVNAFEMPAVSALVPELVEKHEIADALAIDRSTFHLTRFAGPAIAGLVIGLWGPAVAFFANALSFIPLMIALWSLPTHPQGQPEVEEADESDNGGIKAGLAYVRRDPPTFAMIGIMACVTLFPMPCLLVLLPLYARQIGLDATGMGLMMAINAAGAFLGSILLLRVPRSQRPPTIGLAALGVGGGLVGLAVVVNGYLATAMLFGLSVCLALTFGLVNTTVQERVPGRLRGRVSAVSQLTFFGMQPFTALTMAALADGVGLKAAFLIAGPLYALAVVALVLGPGKHVNDTVAPPAEEAEPVAAI